MDNIAHTLAGLALAETGLKRRTALATTALAIGANLPDIDVGIYLFGNGADAIGFRRGWTHGVLAMLVLPIVLAAGMVAWDRLVRRSRRHGAREAVRGGQMLIVAALGVWSHPLLDLLNTYGVRLLMPFSGTWFYGDTLFIVDPWMWLLLGVGVVLARRRSRRVERELIHPARQASWVTRPARLTGAAFLVYVAAMLASSRWADRVVIRQTTLPEPGGDAATPLPPPRTMIAPAPVTPFRRDVVRDLGDRYEVGVVQLGLRSRYAPVDTLLKGSDAPGVDAAIRTPAARKLLGWARFPRFTTTPAGDSIRVRITDVRYAEQDWASVDVVVRR
jgi:inner membrane protein